MEGGGDFSLSQRYSGNRSSSGAKLTYFGLKINNKVSNFFGGLSSHDPTPPKKKEKATIDPPS